MDTNEHQSERSSEDLLEPELLSPTGGTAKSQGSCTVFVRVHSYHDLFEPLTKWKVLLRDETRWIQKLNHGLRR